MSELKKIKKNTKVVVAARHHQSIIGSCGIEKLGRRQNHIARLGIALLKKYRGQGIGTHFIKYSINLALEKLKISKIVLDCFANNHVALSLYKKLGFKQYAVLPKAVNYKGKLIDKISFYKDF